jgi:hypothetical protein
MTIVDISTPLIFDIYQVYIKVHNNSVWTLREWNMKPTNCPFRAFFQEKIAPIYKRYKFVTMQSCSSNQSPENLPAGRNHPSKTVKENQPKREITVINTSSAE